MNRRFEEGLFVEHPAYGPGHGVLLLERRSKVAQRSTLLWDLDLQYRESGHLHTQMEEIQAIRRLTGHLFLEGWWSFSFGSKPFKIYLLLCEKLTFLMLFLL
jgi:hypothetical protein